MRYLSLAFTAWASCGCCGSPPVGQKRCLYCSRCYGLSLDAPLHAFRFSSTQPPQRGLAGNSDYNTLSPKCISVQQLDNEPAV